MAAKKSGKPVRPGGSSADLSKPIKSVTQAQKDMNRKPRGQMRTGGSEVVNMGGKKMIMDWKLDWNLVEYWIEGWAECLVEDLALCSELELAGMEHPFGV
jgi:hypothetical protein